MYKVISRENVLLRFHNRLDMKPTKHEVCKPFEVQIMNNNIHMVHLVYLYG